MSKFTVGLCLLGLACAAFAQSDRGTITGTITDPAGAVLAAAPIELRNIDTGGIYQTASSATGNYTLAQLPAGVYSMSVQVTGFKRYLQENIRVQVAQTVRINVPLEVGSASESITVTDEVTLLKTESGELSHTVEAARLNNLPILGIGGGNSSSQGIRFFLAQTQLIPGASFSTGVAGVRINGAPNNTMRVQVDGMDATNALIPFSSASTQPSVDAIEETSIQTSNYSAEFGQVGGGMFNVTMRSGANNFHGGGYDYLANEALNAATPYVNTKPRIRRNDYGFNLGGPVTIPSLYQGRDRTFFFFNFEQYREFFQTNDRPITVPTDAYRSGDFSGVFPNAPRTAGTDPIGRRYTEGTIFDPASTTTAADGRVYRDAFPGNMIPSTRMDQVALKIQNLIPTATRAGNINNLIPSFPNDRLTSNASIKVDQQIGAKAKLSGYFGTNKTAAQYSQQLNGSVGLPLPIDNTRGTFTQSWTYRVNFDYTLAPTVLFHLGAGMVYYSFNDNSPVLDYDSVAELGLKGATVRGGAGGRFPQLLGLSASAGGMVSMGPGAQSRSGMTTPTANATLTWVKDNHTYKFGAEIRPQGFVGHYLTGSNGSYTFSANQTGQPYLGTTTTAGGSIGFPYASFLLGAVNNGTINYPADVRTGKNSWALYAQDSWKVTRTLTLDYGLRWDYSTYPREQYGRMPSLDALLANPSAGNHPGATIFEATCGCRFSSNYALAFGPRIGLAYQITPKTVLRAGFGISYNATGSGGQNFAAQNNPFVNPAFGEASMFLGSGIPQNFYDPWPNLSPGVFPSQGNPTALAGPSVVVDPNSGRPARQMQWSIGLQREILSNLVVEASYVANRGVWWTSGSTLSYNGLQDSILSAYGLSRDVAGDRAILNARLNTAAAGRFRNQFPYSGFPGTANVRQALRPFPQFASGLAAQWAPTGITWYDSLQLKVTKRYSSGLDFSYNFTWSKELTMGTDGVVNDVFNRAQNKHISSASRPLVSILAMNYVLQPWGPNRIVSSLVRDWTLGAVLQYASGTPIASPTSANQLSTVNFQGTFWNRVPGQPLFLKDLNCHCIDPRQDLVLNPAAWTDAAAGQFSVSAPYYDDFRYQRRPSESMSVARIFRVKERASLMVRVEFSNVFNRTQMANPTGVPNTATRRGGDGSLSGGYGFININSVAQQPRQGTAVIRFTF